MPYCVFALSALGSYPKLCLFSKMLLLLHSVFGMELCPPQFQWQNLTRQNHSLFTKGSLLGYVPIVGLQSLSKKDALSVLLAGGQGAEKNGE